MGARLHGRWAMVLAAVGLFAVVTALSFVVGGDTSEGIPLLYTLPIALLAVQFGLGAGVAGTGMGLGLFAAWAVAEDAGVGAIGYLTHAAASLVSGFAGVVPVGRPGGGSGWFERSNEMLAEASLAGYFIRLSDQLERCLGWTREELMARPFREFIHPDDLAATLPLARSLDEQPGEIVNFGNRYRAKDGSWRWLLWTVRSDEDRKYAVARDVTHRKQLEQEREELLARVEAMARTDALTGLPNRRSWDEEVRHAPARPQRHGHPLALAMVDSRPRQALNDAHGHAAGDALLVEAAVQWRLRLRATDGLPGPLRRRGVRHHAPGLRAGPRRRAARSRTGGDTLQPDPLRRHRLLAPSRQPGGPCCQGRRRPSTRPSVSAGTASWSPGGNAPDGVRKTPGGPVLRHLGRARYGTLLRWFRSWSPLE